MRTLAIVMVVLSLGLVTLTVLGVIAYLDRLDQGDIEDRLAREDLRMEELADCDGPSIWIRPGPPLLFD